MTHMGLFIGGVKDRTTDFYCTYNVHPKHLVADDLENLWYKTKSVNQIDDYLSATSEMIEKL